MRTSLNQPMQDMGSSSRKINFHPLKTQAYTWDPRVAIIRKELVDLTGDSDIAVVLNQLLYWSQRVKDYDLLLEEEKSFPYQETLLEKDEHIEEGLGSCTLAQYGWFYKTTSGLIEETLLCVSRVTMRRYLNVLLERGWIQERGNSQYKWDRTTHYRVNLYQLDKDLKAIGYGLPGFILEEDIIGIDENRQKTSLSKIEPSMVQNFTLECKENHSSLPATDENRQKSSMSKNEPSMVQNLTLECKESEHSNVKKWSFITENKTENKNREHRTGRARTGAYTHAYEEGAGHFDREQETPPPSAKVAALMVDLWRRYVSPEAISLTDERKRRLESLLELHFQADLRLWESFCLRVKAAPFLMGEGKRKWQVTLDWILAKGNFLRVLEGNFDDSECIEHEKNEQFKSLQDRETHALLGSITDLVWKNWCSQWLGIHPLTGGSLMDGAQPLKAPLVVSELKQITEARFMEFDGRLVWIECFDQKTLDKIEDLRLKLLSVVQATFPEARAVRGHLNLSAHHPPFTQQKGENDAE